MKTKQRILVTSLALFNELGEPNVTTVDISNEMEISPGNLYYHYRNKDDIVGHIVTQYDQEISHIFQAERALDGLIEHWLFLKVILEKNWAFRFIFRDFENLVGKYKRIERKLYRIQHKLHKAMTDFGLALADSAQSLNTFQHLDGVAENMVTVLCRNPLQNKVDTSLEPDDMFTHASFQVLLILWPWLSEEDKHLLEALAMSC